MMVHPGKSQIGKRQTAQLSDRVVRCHRAVAHICHQLPNKSLIHYHYPASL